MSDDLAFDLPTALEQAQNGNRAPLGQILQSLRPYLLNVARDAVPDDYQYKVRPSDVFQDTCVLALENIEHLHGATSEQLLGWMIAITHRVVQGCIRQVLTGKRDARKEVPQARHQRPLEVVDRRAEAPVDAAANREAVYLVFRARKRLPKEDQQLVDWWMKNKAIDEVARELGIGVEAACKRMTRTLHRFCESMRRL